MCRGFSVHMNIERRTCCVGEQYIGGPGEGAEISVLAAALMVVWWRWWGVGVRGLAVMVVMACAVGGLVSSLHVADNNSSGNN